MLTDETNYIEFYWRIKSKCNIDGGEDIMFPDVLVGRLSFHDMFTIRGY